MYVTRRRNSSLFLTTIFYYLILQEIFVVVHTEDQNQPLFSRCTHSTNDENIFDHFSYDIEDHRKENIISFSKYQGKTLLIVITASFCQYTSQYPSLNQLKTYYRTKNFEILAFPSNQFGLQEPGTTGKEILNSIRFVRPGNNYIPNFPMFERSDVNGYAERPLFTYLKSVCPSPIEEFRPWPNITYTPVRSNDLRWNFEKFLIDSNGQAVKRFVSDVTPLELIPHIDQQLMLDKDRLTFLSRQVNDLLLEQ